MERTLENLDMVALNYTQHDVVVYAEDKKTVLKTIPSSGNATVEVSAEFVGNICTIPVVKSVFGEVKGLPSPQEGVYYIVSRMVKDRLPDREDVICPDTGSTSVRDNGKILGVTRFTY